MVVGLPRWRRSWYSVPKRSCSLDAGRSPRYTHAGFAGAGGRRYFVSAVPRETLDWLRMAPATSSSGPLQASWAPDFADLLEQLTATPADVLVLDGVSIRITWRMSAKSRGGGCCDHRAAITQCAS